MHCNVIGFALILVKTMSKANEAWEAGKELMQVDHLPEPSESRHH